MLRPKKSAHYTRRRLTICRTSWSFPAFFAGFYNIGGTRPPMFS
jgi:hypothetical protein